MPWETKDEIDFLRGLDAKGRLRYYRTMHLRERWEGIDKDVLTNWLEGRIRRDCGLRKDIKDAFNKMAEG